MISRSTRQIVFIKPPQDYLLDPDRNPPLGLMYIAAIAEKLGHEVRYVDFSCYSDDKEVLNEIPVADVYAITVSILDYCWSHKICGLLKKRSPCATIFGGVFPTTTPDLVNYEVVDSIIIGEGEIAFENFMADVISGAKLRQRYVAPNIEDLDTIPFPLRKNGIKYKNTTLLAEGVMATTVMSTRGCPFGCTFCASKTMWGRRVRFRSVENTLAEVDHLLTEHGVQGIRFLDDTITLRLDRFQALCQGLKDRKIIWRCSTTSNLITDELAAQMAESGCVEAGIGVESADPVILKTMEKGIKVEQNERAIRAFKKAGVKAACFFISGLPGEKEDTADLNIEFIRRTQPDRVFSSTFMPYPGTPVWINPEKYKVQILTKDITRYNQVSGVGEEEREFIVIPEGMTYEKLAQNRKKMIDFLAEHNKIRA